jgi:hypothetical protein
LDRKVHLVHKENKGCKVYKVSKVPLGLKVPLDRQANKAFKVRLAPKVNRETQRLQKISEGLLGLGATESISVRLPLP